MGTRRTGVPCRSSFFAAVSVSVGVWTLVAISLERYFAICRPLKSRRWQTQFHAYKMIAFVWAASLIWSSPVLVVSSLQAMKGKGEYKLGSMPSDRRAGFITYAESQQRSEKNMSGTYLLANPVITTIL